MNTDQLILNQLMLITDVLLMIYGEITNNKDLKKILQLYFSATGGNADAIQKMSEMRENIKNGRI